MSSIVLVLGTLGAWQLFAGAIYQSAQELREHENAISRIRRTLSTVPAPPPVSWWWWWLPPVKMVLEWRRGKTQRQGHLAALSIDECVSLVAYIHKANGWLLVGMGASSWPSRRRTPSPSFTTSETVRSAGSFWG